MTVAHINRIGAAVPDHDIHASFIAFARTLLAEKTRAVFDRMAERSGIAHRYSAFRPGDIAGGEVDADGFYRRGRFPGTAARMALYEQDALALALRAVETLVLTVERERITHLVVASCTGFTAPGLDLQLASRLGLRPDVERTLIGFMGCSAAVPALRLAHHAVRSDPAARVLVVNLELCTLHLQETSDLETVLSFLLFGDGCAAALVTAEPAGIALGDFCAAVIPDTADLITWQIGEQGFRMHLSGKVPGRIAQALRAELARPDADGILRGQGTQAVDLWAVHAGGRTVLDAVETGLALQPSALRQSRAVLQDCGNMSSATLMFVLQRMLRERESGDIASGARGLAVAFGPGMVAETFRFALAG
ncbi:MAG: type III polyketide synthase [Pseudomonadota bacterium]|nr:type III polyketide synthase [Pseudomonadota bacterium]